MKVALVVLGILVVFVGGAALFDEHVAGWSGFLPVGRVSVTTHDRRNNGELAVDAAPETVWRSLRGPGYYLEANFPPNSIVSQVWTDTGNDFRLHPSLLSMHLAFTPSAIAEPILVSLTKQFAVWRAYTFEPRHVSSVKIECSVRGEGSHGWWGLRDVRFVAPGAFHWDRDAWFRSWEELPLPAIVAMLWCFALWRLACRARRRVEA